MPGEIFLSYRRDDSAGTTGRLYDRLVRTFPRQKVFMDVDAAMHGLDFVRVLNEKIAACDAVAVVIGTRWLSVTDQAGNRRVDNPHDFVRIEVAAALKREIAVIPVLVDGATMPSKDDLPDDLKPLVRRPAITVRNTRFRADADLLVSSLAQRLGVANRKKWQSREVAALVALVAAAVGLGALLRSPLSPDPSLEHASRPQPSQATVSWATDTEKRTASENSPSTTSNDPLDAKEASERLAAIEANERRLEQETRDRIKRLEAEAEEAARRRAEFEAQERKRSEAAAEARATAAREAAERERQQAEEQASRRRAEFEAEERRKAEATARAQREAAERERQQAAEAERQRQAAAQVFIPSTSWAHSYPSRAAAERAALSTCPGSCKIAIWVNNACAAIAIGESGGWGAAWHPNRKRAERASIANCASAGNQGCSVRQWICSRGYGAISVQTGP